MRSSIRLALAVVLSLIAVPAHADLYRLVDLGTLGGRLSSGAAINNAGQVTGGSHVAGLPEPDRHAFLYSGGVMTDLGTLGGNFSNGFAINSSGQIVGLSDFVGAPFAAAHAFLYSGGVMTDLGALGGIDSRAFGINDSSQVVGFIHTTVPLEPEQRGCPMPFSTATAS